MEPLELKAWRERNHLTQQSASDALGISRRTLVAYEQGESSIPRTVEYACNWLDKNPTAIVSRDRLRIALTSGRTAGTPEVALASMSLIKRTLATLNEVGMISREQLRDIFNSSIEEHTESPTGNRPWTQPVAHLIRDTFHDLTQTKNRNSDSVPGVAKKPIRNPEHGEE